MNEPDPRRRDCDRDSRRRETPLQRARHTASRSRSRIRTRSPSHAERDRDREWGRERVELLERELQRERDRLRRVSKGRRRTPSRHGSEHRGRSREPRDSRHGDSNPEPRVDAAEQRSCSPSLSKKDCVDILKCLRDGFSTQPTENPPTLQKIDFNNILPSFDPSSKTQRIDVWLKKVNECASVYGWDDKTTTHFAMQKLQGLAKTWYESLNSILFTWKEWEGKLVSAFPFEQNYGQALEEMLRRKSRFNEAIEVYYYEKLTLLNRCDIVGKRAVDCIIHGISDRTLRSGALALRCLDPDLLLQYLVSNKDSSLSIVDRTQFQTKSSETIANPNSKQNNGFRHPSGGCYNCKEKGHSFLYCPKPLIKCLKCSMVGHTSDSCFVKTGGHSMKNTVNSNETDSNAADDNIISD